MQYVGTWQFAEHQWDYFGNSQSDNHRDLFGWGTGNNPNNVSTDYTDYASYIEWCNNPISNGGNQANMWRTLTNDEWVYLFNTRTDAGNKYGAAKVNGKAGIVLLPDNWTLPSGCGFTAGMTSASSWDDWSLVASTNIYEGKAWDDMEKNGAVFLPAAGMRIGTGVGDVGSNGRYWSATRDDADLAYDLNFNSGYLNPQGGNGLHYALSVRLVR